MLQNLHIQNYALIEMLDIDFNAGFSVITGETGAGKSIILGALAMVLGGRSETRSIKVGATKCVVEATFDLSGIGLDSFFADNNLDFDGSECVIRRELLQSGKSRAFINDTPASLVQLKELGDKLLDVHSQHQNLLLNKENFQLNILDILAGNEQRLKDYEVCFHEYKDTCKALAEATDLAEKAKADAEKAKADAEAAADDAEAQKAAAEAARIAAEAAKTAAEKAQAAAEAAKLAAEKAGDEASAKAAAAAEEAAKAAAEAAKKAAQDAKNAADVSAKAAEDADGQAFQDEDSGHAHAADAHGFHDADFTGLLDDDGDECGGDAE